MASKSTQIAVKCHIGAKRTRSCFNLVRINFRALKEAGVIDWCY